MANLTKDQRIIRDNPGKSPYELKELGISDKAFEELLTNAPAEPAPAIEESLLPPPPAMNWGSIPEEGQQKAKAKVTQTPVTAQPRLSVARPMNLPVGQAILVSPTGKQTNMTRAAAERWVRDHPGKGWQVI